MGRHHRKLWPEPCPFPCNQPCSLGCSYSPPFYNPPVPPGPPKDAGVDHSNKHHKISTFMILGVAIVSATFLFVCCYIIYARFFRSRVRVSSRRQIEEIRDDFLDEEHGPVLDHPIWYIRTTGLQQSIISAITVCKYKKGEGLIEGTECSVCLSEFQEDENLRLLPKCNHAFHLPCIDTWLRSHTNCPMCRAPIVTDPATWATTVPSLEPNVVDSSSMEMEVLANSGETSEGMENTQTSDAELRNRAEEEGQLEVEDERRVIETENSAAEVVNMIQPRRSVSFDASSAAKINLALSSVVSVESKRVKGNGNLRSCAKGSSSSRTRHLQSAPSSMKRSRSYNGKHLLSRSSCSQKKPNTLVRSF